ncbi:MAG: acetyl-CoA carboxylase biotin carboxyl carrier protein subunit [Desulfobacterales bacterium]|nr:acetyl-CoA carboxylase biotin carboxyl carrier protein subunit [Desulfobacterales bacterium]
MSKQILAPMPGKVVDILVKTGEEVLEYQEVLILEAMKMENAIPSPEAGQGEGDQGQERRHGGRAAGADGPGVVRPPIAVPIDAVNAKGPWRHGPFA